MMKNNRQCEAKKITRAVFTGVLVAAFTFPLQGCNEKVPVSEPFESTPAKRVLVEELDAATKDAVILGGRLYDNWFSLVPSATVPSINNPMAKFFKGYAAAPVADSPYAKFILLEKNDQYRCNTCHGFEYTGSEEFGPGGVLAAESMALKDIEAVIRGGFWMSFGSDKELVHGFAALGLGDAEISALANFIKYGLVNVEEYLHPFSPLGSKIGKGDVEKGSALFKGAAGCARSSCHGADGKLIPFKPNEYVGTIGKKEPAEMLHKIRFGQPGKNAMPTIYGSGLTTQDAVDIMTYTQQLPE